MSLTEGGRSILVPVIAAIVTSIVAFMGQSALKTDRQEVLYANMQERVGNLEGRITSTDRAQAVLEGRLVRLEVSLDRIGSDVREIRQDIKALTYRPSVLRKGESAEAER